MIARCKISGYSWTVSPVLFDTSIITTHPIFDMSTGAIARLWKDRALDSWARDDIKLFCIAALKGTELLAPNSNTVQWEQFPLSVALKTTEPLINIIAALDSHPRLKAEMPLYRIAQHHVDNYTDIPPSMANLPEVVDTWTGIIADYRKNARIARANDDGDIALDMLSRVVFDSSRPEKAARRLSIYTFNVIPKPLGKVGTNNGIIQLYEYYQAIIALAGKPDIHERDMALIDLGASITDLQSCLEYVQDNSGLGDIYIYRTIDLLKATIKSYSDAMSPSLLPDYADQNIAQKALSDAIASAPAQIVKPEKHQFKNVVDYYRALGVWQLQKQNKGA